MTTESTHLSDIGIESLRVFLDELCDETGAIANAAFRQPLDVERKADSSPVTEVDRGIETLLRKRIAERFPTHAILGEEFGGEALDDQPLWVLDPIDGTKNFITGKPLFGTLIGVCIAGVPRIGVIDMPALGERWLALGDLSTTGLGTVSQCSGQTELSRASLYATTPDMFAGQDHDAFEALSRSIAFRSFGADCYGYALLAEGYVDMVFEAQLAVHDFCALVPVIEGAGGVMTDWSGDRLTVHSDGRVLAAASKALHEKALEEIRRFV